MDKHLIALIFLAFVLYGANTWGTAVYVLDEAKNSGCAMEMAERSDWVVPTFNDALRTDKPPLHYYFMKVAYAAIGVNPFAARFFSVVMGVLTVLCVYLFTKELANKEAAFWSALFLTVSIQLTLQFHLAVPDPYLIFFLTAALFSFYKGYRDDKPLFFYLFYAGIALATLAKGPVAVVFSGLIILVFLLFRRDFTWRRLMRIRLFHGILIFCLIVLPWYILVGIATDGEWLQKFFLDHNVGRFTSTMEGHGGFPLASFVIVLGALLPFSFFAPQAIRAAWKQRAGNPFLLFCLIACLVIVLFFAFSRTILPNYPEPSLPFLSVILGAFFSQQIRSTTPVALGWNAFVYLLISLAIPLVAWFALKQDDTLAPITYMAGYCAILSLGGVAGFVFIVKKQRTRALYSYVVASSIFLLFFFYTILPRLDGYNPVMQSLAHMDKKNKIVCYKNLNPAFVFALRRPVPVFQSVEEIESFSDHENKFYLITQSRYLDEIDVLRSAVVYEGKDLFENTTTVVVVID